MNTARPARIELARPVLVVGIRWTAVPTLAQNSQSPITGLQRDVIFSEYSSLSRNVELARRTLRPLANVEITRASDKSPLRVQAIDLNKETFAVYVPAKQPPQGFGLLSLIPRWQEARLPPGWTAVFDENGADLRQFSQIR
jgi:hypothetical protein